MDEQIAELRERIEDHLRRYGAESSRLIDQFAKIHAMHPTDFQALVAIVNAQRQGTPATPELSVGYCASPPAPSPGRSIDWWPPATSRAGPDEQDRRQTRLHWQGPAMALAYEFFGPLAARTEPLMARYGVAELRTIEGFMADMAEAMADYRADLEAGQAS